MPQRFVWWAINVCKIPHLPSLLRFIPQFAQICIIFVLSKFGANLKQIQFFFGLWLLFYELKSTSTEHPVLRGRMVRLRTIDSTPQDWFSILPRWSFFFPFKSLPWIFFLTIWTVVEETYIVLFHGNLLTRNLKRHNPIWIANTSRCTGPVQPFFQGLFEDHIRFPRTTY